MKARTGTGVHRSMHHYSTSSCGRLSSKRPMFSMGDDGRQLQCSIAAQSSPCSRNTAALQIQGHLKQVHGEQTHCKSDVPSGAQSGCLKAIFDKSLWIRRMEGRRCRTASFSGSDAMPHIRRARFRPSHSPLSTHHLIGARSKDIYVTSTGWMRCKR